MVYELKDYQKKEKEDIRQAFEQGSKAVCLVSPCGSGKTVVLADIAKEATDKGCKVLFLAHRIEIIEQATKTFESQNVDMNLCDMTMVQTAARRLSKLPNYDLILTDEGHHCKAESYIKIYDHFSAALKIFVTATPIRLGKKKTLGGICDSMIIGPSVQELIDKQQLADYKYFAPPTSLDFSNVKKVNGDYNTTMLFDMLNQNSIYGDVVKCYKDKAINKQAICYCVNIEHSKKVAETFNNHRINALHIDAQTPKKERIEAIEKFRTGECKILCNVNLISEGFDVPDCEVVILLRPTLSLSLYIQQAMRCMRYKYNKTAIIIDHVNNILKHGSPKTERNWTLIEDEYKESIVEEFREIICKSCHAVLPYFTYICPECGYEIRKKVTEPTEIQKEIDLEEFDEDKYFKQYKRISDCTTEEEMIRWSVLHGKHVNYGKACWKNRKKRERIKNMKNINNCDTEEEMIIWCETHGKHQNYGKACWKNRLFKLQSR